MEGMNDKTMNQVDDGYPAGLKFDAWLAVALGALAGILYALTRCAVPAAGLPAHALASALPGSASPMMLSPFWGAMAAAFGGEACVPTWLNVVFGAASVGILSFVVMRVRYAVHDRNDEEEGRREHQARYLSGAVAGLFLAVAIPSWVAATRSVPDMFHLFLLMLALWVFSEYQRAGGPKRLWLLGALVGAGAVEFPTFWLLAPFIAVLVARAQLQRAEFRWKTMVATAVCAGVAAAAGYVWAGSRTGAMGILQVQGVSGFWSGLGWFLKSQARWLFVATRGTGFLLSLSLTLLPWAILFLLRAKKPAWRYSAWVVVLRVLVLAACLCVVWDAPLTPWHFFGMSYLMVTPVAILAACAGYVAGEFWVMGQRREHRKAGVGQPLRSLLGWCGALMPAAVVAAGVWNWPVVDARPGKAVAEAAADAVERLGGADVVLSDGALDDLVALEAKKRGMDVLVVPLPATATASYRKWLGETRFTDLRSKSLLELGFGPFLQDFAHNGGGLDRTVLLGAGEHFRDIGEPVPDGLLNRLADEAPTGEALTALVDAQRPFWASAATIGKFEGAAWAEKRMKRENPLYPFALYVRLSASKQANNAACALLDEGRVEEGENVLLLAREIAPENRSVLLNLLMLAEGRGETNTVYREEWNEFVALNRDSRVLWQLADRFGYIHNAGMLIRQGMMWAVSGKPKRTETELRRSQGRGGKKDIDASLKAFLGRMYLLNNDQERGEEYYRQVLEEKPGDPDTIYALAKLDIQRGDVDAAKEKLAQLEAAGVPPEKLSFERALLLAAEGNTRGALSKLAQMGREQPGNILVPALTAVLAQGAGDAETADKAIESLRKMPTKSLQLRLFLAQMMIMKRDWASARGELEPLTRMNPGNARVWEALLQVDHAERKRDQAEDHVRVLLTLDPENALGNLILASIQRERGQLALAESSYRAALKAERRPDVLNDLADLLLRKGMSEKERPAAAEAALDEATKLLDEALSIQPNYLTALATRAEVNLVRDNLDAAEADLQKVLAEVPDNALAMFLSARLYAKRGNLAAARDLAATIDSRRDAMPPDMLEEFRAFQAELKRGPAAQ
jgi:predicted Zn-dependent protease